MPKGISKTPELTRQKRILLMSGDKNPAKRPEIRAILSRKMMGRYAKEKNHKWKGGISGIYKLHNHPDYRRAIQIKPDKCDICGVFEKNLPRKLAFDHNHKTNKFRGWLCSNCNRGLGLLGDDLEKIKKVLIYLDV